MFGYYTVQKFGTYSNVAILGNVPGLTQVWNALKPILQASTQTSLKQQQHQEHNQEYIHWSENLTNKKKIKHQKHVITCFNRAIIITCDDLQDTL